MGRRPRRSRSRALAALIAALPACELSHPLSVFADAGDATARADLVDAATTLDLPEVPTVDTPIASDVPVTDVPMVSDVPIRDVPITDVPITDVPPPTDVVAPRDVPVTIDVPAPQDVVNADVGCAAPSRACGGACVDVRSSLAHCGACDSPCGTRCVDGRCQDVTAFAVGTAHTCAILRAGRLHCWGTNAQGQVGNGATANQLRPAAIEGIDVSEISLGANHSCAVLRDGTVRCWGDNANGRLGDGTNIARRTPTAVTGLPRPATQVACGDNFTCARLDDGTLRCWGAGNEGQLGDGAMMERRAPVLVTTITEVRAVSAGRDFACALLASGLPYCWGHNDHGQLGDGSMAMNRATPTLVMGLTEVTHLAAADDHTCALRADGSAWCWGENNENQLGDGSSAARRSPVRVEGLTGVRAVALGCGGNQCCVALADGAVRCWGDNAGAQLGDGTTTDRGVATPVPGLTGVSRVGTRGTGTTCALRGATLLCWGLNGGGQLGDGTTSQRLAPAPVVF